jgi:hypothetical protein
MPTTVRKVSATTPLWLEQGATVPAGHEVSTAAAEDTAATFGAALQAPRAKAVRFELPAEEEAKPDPNGLYHFEFAKYVNTHTTDYIRMADAKAAILTTLLSANLLVLVQKAGQYIAEGHVAWRLTLVMIAVVFAMVSLGVTVNIIRPRLFRNAERSHIFWEDVAAQDKAAYAASFQGMDTDAICRELGEHNHNMAQSATRKFRWLRISFRLAIVSVCFSATIILLTSA